ALHDQRRAHDRSHQHWGDLGEGAAEEDLRRRHGAVARFRDSAWRRPSRGARQQHVATGHRAEHDDAVRGRDMTYVAHYPDGRSETLLSVPKYDFNWQITYELAQPKLLPKDTRLEVIAHSTTRRETCSTRTRAKPSAGASRRGKK